MHFILKCHKDIGDDGTLTFSIHWWITTHQCVKYDVTMFVFPSKTEVPVLKPLSELLDLDTASQKEEVHKFKYCC